MSATATRPDYQLSPPQTSFFDRHHSCWRISRRAFLVQQRRAGRCAPIRRNFPRRLQTIPFRIFVEWAFIFLPILYHGGYGIYIWLRGQVECFGISVGQELAFHAAALHRPDRFRLHRLALVHGALADSRHVDLRDGCAAICRIRGIWRFFLIGDSGFFVSPGRRHLEFSLQVGTGRDRARATRRRATRRARRRHL